MRTNSSSSTDKAKSRDDRPPTTSPRVMSARQATMLDSAQAALDRLRRLLSNHN
jgi:hypothetical protein